MDVIRATLLLFIILLISTGCSQPEENNQIFKKSKTKICQKAEVKNRFIVYWKNGRTSIEMAKDQKTFKKEFIQKNKQQIAFAEHDFKISVSPLLPKTIEPLNTTFINNWGAKSIEADRLWQQDIRGQNVIVAVIDSGLDIQHPELSNQIAYNTNELPDNGLDDDQNGLVDDYAGFNFIDDSNDVTDNLAHGTHVSGIIAAEHYASTIENGYVQGVAPLARILPLKFLDRNGGGFISGAIEAIDYALTRGARIINASWGGSGCSQALREKIQSLANRNVLFVAAAGNNGNNLNDYPEYPAAFTSEAQITVGAITSFLGMAGFSNYSWDRVQIFAPGANITSTIPDNQYAANDGTSMAAPFVSGAAALLWSQYPAATLPQIKQALLSSSTFSRDYVNATQGRLNVNQALIELATVLTP